jgi:hypothetical protein
VLVGEVGAKRLVVVDLTVHDENQAVVVPREKRLLTRNRVDNGEPFVSESRRRGCVTNRQRLRVDSAPVRAAVALQP